MLIRKSRFHEEANFGLACVLKASLYVSLYYVVVGDAMLTEKKCKGPCGLLKSIDEFHWKSKRRGTRQARCKACMSDYGHKHYVANSQEYKDRANSRLQSLRTDNRNFVKTHLETHPCFKCGEANPKSLSINVTSTEVNNLATSELLAKLESSVVICRNCQASQD